MDPAGMPKGAEGRYRAACQVPPVKKHRIGRSVPCYQGITEFMKFIGLDTLWFRIDISWRI